MLKTADEVKQWLATSDLGKILAETPGSTSPDMLRRITEGVALMAYKRGAEDGAIHAKQLILASIKQAKRA